MKIDFLPQPAVIEAIDQRVADHHVFRIRPVHDIQIEPGQFVELSIAGVGAFPVSPSRCGEGRAFESCIRRTGRVTSALYRLREGVPVGLRGPFGNGFPIDQFTGRDVLLLAGGLGMAPLMGLLRRLLDRRAEFGEITLLYGSREPATLLFHDELVALAAQGLVRVRFSVDFAVELPWGMNVASCRVGLVTELLDGLTCTPGQTTVAVCGPPVLYSCVLEELAALGFPPERIFATLERRMQCGIGQCCHCVTGGTFICQDGPVFPLTRLRAIDGAI